jgi:uncharacterized protein (DUF58 family)
MVLILTGVSVPLLLVRGAEPALAALWALAALAALADLMLSTPARRVAAEVTLPAVGYAGGSVAAQLRLEPVPGALPERMELRLDAAPELGLGRAVWREGRAAEVPVKLTRRGRFVVSGLALKWPSRLGLFEIIGRWPLSLEIAVVPDITPVLSGTIQAQMLPLMEGQKDMRIAGEGSEFHQLRDFVPGMDPRAIDWKRSARANTLVARETRAERNHQIVLCIDSGRLMAEEVGGVPKLDRAINAALALAWAGGLGGDLVGLYSYDSQPRLYVPPMPGRAAFARLKTAAADLAASGTESNPTLALTHLAGRLARRSLIIVFSDFVDSTTAELLVDNFGLLARRHLILHVALRDPALEAIAHPETISLDSVALAVSAGQIARERQVVLDRLARLGVLCLDTEPEKLTAALVSRYIEIKAREMI